MSTEVTLYSDGDILITKQRAVLGAKTFAMAQIASVSTGVIHPDTKLAWGLIIGGVILGLCTMGIGLIATIIGVIMLKNAKTFYAVRLGSSNGEIDGLVSTDREYVERIVAALNSAIIDRG